MKFTEFEKSDYQVWAGAEPLPDGRKPMIAKLFDGVVTVIICGESDRLYGAITVGAQFNFGEGMTYFKTMPKEAVEVVGIDDVISFHEDLLDRLSSPPERFSVQDLLLCNGFERVL